MLLNRWYIETESSEAASVTPFSTTMTEALAAWESVDGKWPELLRDPSGMKARYLGIPHWAWFTVRSVCHRKGYKC